MTRPKTLNTGGPISFWRDRKDFVVLLVLIACALLFGGASRPEVLPLILLRPLAMAALVYGLWSTSSDQMRRNGELLALFATSCTLVALHLVPLPPGLWRHLPERELLARIYDAAGLAGTWHPLTFDPTAGLNALLSLSVPGAVLLLAMRLDDRSFARALALVAAIGTAGAFVSLFQVAGAATGPLFFYRITNNGSAVGFFANRNHQALFLATLFPILACLAATAPAIVRKPQLVRWMALIVAAVLPPLILITGSRSGLITGALALGLGAVIYRFCAIERVKSRTSRKPIPRAVVIGTSVGAFLLLLALTVVLSRAEALQRILATNASEDLRFQVLGPILSTTWKFLPFGSGAGSFVPVYKIYEPDALLMATYLNHVHNDWIEVVMTMGGPGAALMVWGLVWYARRCARTLSALRRNERAPATGLALTAEAIIALLLLGSLLDYPLRTPALAALLALCAVMCDRQGTVHQRTSAR